MRLARATATLVCALGSTVAVAQRVFVNPAPQSHFKALFPAAVTFSQKEGDPPVFKAYAVKR